VGTRTTNLFVRTLPVPLLLGAALTSSCSLLTPGNPVDF
jgi:hypothetical protein